MKKKWKKNPAFDKATHGIWFPASGETLEQCKFRHHITHLPPIYLGKIKVVIKGQ